MAGEPPQGGYGEVSPLVRNRFGGLDADFRGVDFVVQQHLLALQCQLLLVQVQLTPFEAEFVLFRAQLQGEPLHLGDGHLHLLLLLIGHLLQGLELPSQLPQLRLQAGHLIFRSPAFRGR